MADLSARMRIQNKTDKPRVVWVEPWGEDYTLLKDEELEIVTSSSSEQPWFFVVEWPESTQVYLEGTSSDFKVLQNGNALKCGHNRQVTLDRS